MAARRVPKAGLIAAVAIVLLMFLMAKRPIPEEELARRVAQSAPSWNNYDEDLKAQLGAAPVAEWKGDILGIRWDGATLKVRFSLRGDWAERDIAIPVLIRLPDGETSMNQTASREGREVVYSFPAQLESPPQWVIVRYPFYGERRIVLSEEGTWDSGEN